MERGPQIGDRSPDGSRVYDGKYWVLQRTAPVIEEYVPPAEQHLRLHEFPHERGGFGFGGLIVAIAVGLVFAYAPYPAIPTNSFDTALEDLPYRSSSGRGGHLSPSFSSLASDGGRSTYSSFAR
jgi:hypothetical protein